MSLAGYWDASENLDRELSLFVAGMWTCLDSCDSEDPYFYNQVRRNFLVYKVDLVQC